jgi:hypothetical protein
MDLLHETIKAGLNDGVDEIWKDKATALQSGWMHIHGEYFSAGLPIMLTSTRTFL